MDFPDRDIAPSNSRHHGLAGPEGEGLGQGATHGLQGEGGLEFEVTGLEYMNDDPGEMFSMLVSRRSQEPCSRWWRG
jgi:hypothetical protein